jgi:hypothetical protein
VLFLLEFELLLKQFSLFISHLLSLNLSLLLLEVPLDLLLVILELGL